MKATDFKKKKESSKDSCKGCHFADIHGRNCDPKKTDLIEALDKKHGSCNKGHIYIKREKIKIHWGYWIIISLILLFIFMCSCQKENVSCFKFSQQQSHSFIFNEDTIHKQCCYPKIFEVCNITKEQSDSIIQSRTFTRDTAYSEEVYIDGKFYPFIDVEILQICSYY